MSHIPNMKELLEAGAHFGHRSNKWNPKMRPFIFAQRDGIHVIDLEKTAPLLKKACEFLKKVADANGIIIFVATKRQAQGIVKEAAESAGAMYMVKRWLGGLLTNFDSVKKTIRKLSDMEETLKEAAQNQTLTKREQVLLQKEIKKLETVVGGIRNLDKLPDALFIVDSKKEQNAVLEAQKTSVPTVALVDTNGDPTKITYPIPINDDAIKSISVAVAAISDAVRDGYGIGKKKPVTEKISETKEIKKTAKLENTGAKKVKKVKIKTSKSKAKTKPKRTSKSKK